MNIYGYVQEALNAISTLDEYFRGAIVDNRHGSVFVDARIYIKKDINTLKVSERKCMIGYEEIARFYMKANHDETATRYHIFNLLVKRLNLFSEYRKLEGFLDYD